MIEACLFDMGGVVDAFDSAAMEKKLLGYFGIRNCGTFAELDSRIPAVRNELLCGNITVEDFWHSFASFTGIVVPDEPGLYTKFFDPVKKADTIAVIMKLKEHGMRVIAATNVEPPHRLWHEARHDYDLFDAVYTSDVLHAAKPSSEFFNKIVVAEGSAPATLFFTDDTVENVESARCLGFSAYHFVSAEALEAQLHLLKIL